MKLFKFRTKLEAACAIFIVAILLTTAVFSVRIITDSNDNIATFITNSNGGVWEATGANLQLAFWNLNDTGGTIFLPGGIINTSGVPNGIIHLVSNVIVEGGNTVIQASSDCDAGAMLYGWNENNITIRDICVDANGIARRTIYFRGDHDIEGLTLENVETKNTITGYIWSGLTVGTGEDYSVSRVKLINCYIHNHSETAKDTVVIGRTDDLYMFGCTFENIGKNVFTYGGSNHKIMGNHFLNSTKVNIQSSHTTFTENTMNNTDIYLRGFEADGGADACNTTYITIAHNEITDGTINIYSIVPHAVYKIRIIGNNIVFESNQSSSDSYGILVQSTNETEILYNTIEKAGRTGIYLSNASEVRIKGNIFRDNAINTALAVRGNIVDFDAAHPSDNITVEGNLFDGEATTVLYHIWLRGNDSIIKGNEFLGDFTQALRLDGDSNDVSRNKNYNYSNFNHFGDTTNYVDVNETGYLTLHGNARTSNALWVDAGGIKSPGLKPAAEIAHGTLETPAWEFGNEAVAGNQESVSWSMRVPHRMDRSVAPTIAVGWSANGVSPGICEWQLEYLWTSVDEDTTAGAQETLTVNGTASSTSNGLIVSAFIGIDVPSATDECIHCKLTRLSAGTNDTIAVTVELHGVCLDFTSNKMGSAIG